VFRLGDRPDADCLPLRELNVSQIGGMLVPSIIFGAIMSLKSTQIYLTEAEHAALERAAARAGCSMTAIVRGLIEQHLVGSDTPPTDLTDLIGVVSTAEPTDIATQKDRLLYEDLLDDVRGHERPLRVAES
jgi:hypothetical protein